MKKAIFVEKPTSFAVGIRNSNHFGITAYYSMMALKNNMSGPAKTGHTFMAVHISRVMDFGRLSSRVYEVISMIKSLPPKWDSGIFMAGEIEYQLTEERLEEGIELEEAVISRLNTVAEKYGAEMLRV